MTAICPAGPPKVCNEIANHAFTAWPNGTTSLTGSGVAVAGVGLGSAAAAGVVAGSVIARTPVVRWDKAQVPWLRRWAVEQQPSAVVLVHAVDDRRRF